MGHDRCLICEISYFFKQWPGLYLEFLYRSFKFPLTVYGLVSMEFDRENDYAFFSYCKALISMVIKPMASGISLPGTISRFLI